MPSQGESEEEALDNLKEALELHFGPPQATRPSKAPTIEVGLDRLKTEYGGQVESLSENIQRQRPGSDPGHRKAAADRVRFGFLYAS